MDARRLVEEGLRLRDADGGAHWGDVETTEWVNEHAVDLLDALKSTLDERDAWRDRAREWEQSHDARVEERVEELAGGGAEELKALDAVPGVKLQVTSWTYWNDQSGRTQEQVVAVLRRAAEEGDGDA